MGLISRVSSRTYRIIMQNLPESQKSILTFENELSEQQKSVLQEQITSLDLATAEIYFSRLNLKNTESNLDQSKLAPVLSDRTNASANVDDYQKWQEIGLKQVADNKVGV